MVATSNRPPKDLHLSALRFSMFTSRFCNYEGFEKLEIWPVRYLNGLNRPLFVPFIPMLEAFCEVHDIGAAARLIACRPYKKDKMPRLDHIDHRSIRIILYPPIDNIYIH